MLHLRDKCTILYNIHEIAIQSRDNGMDYGIIVPQFKICNWNIIDHEK